MFRKVIYNTVSQIAGKAITATTTLLVTIIIARSLGSLGYGEFTKVFVFVGYFYTLADFGMNAIFVRDSKEKGTLLFRTLISTRLIISSFLAVAAIILSFLLPYNDVLNIGFSPVVKLAIAIASITIITQALITTANAFFQKQLRYDLSTIAAILGTTVILFFSVVSLTLSPSIFLFTLAYVLGGLVFASAAFLIIKFRFKNNITPLFSFKESKSLIKKSSWVGFALIFNLIYFRIDIFILSYTRQTQEVGIYGLAYQFFEAALAIPIFFANSLYPLLATIYQQDKSIYFKKVRYWCFLLISASLLLSTLLIIASFFLRPIFGESFTKSQAALIILSLGMPFFFISALLWHVLIIEGKQKMLAPIYLIGGLFNLAINITLIPRYGYLAASATTVLSELLITLLLLIALRLSKIDEHRSKDIK